MGQSTDAILFYGYCWEEETNTPWTIGKDDEEESEDHDEDDEGGEWETRYARLKGVLPPEQPFPNREVPRTRENGYSSTPKDYTKEEQSIIDEYSAYWDKKRKIAETSGVEVGSHCSCDCPMPYVAIKKSEIVSNRGSMSEIKNLDVGEDWDEQLKEFCKLMGIKTKGKPKWWLVSNWC